MLIEPIIIHLGSKYLKGSFGFWWVTMDYIVLRIIINDMVRKKVNAAQFSIRIPQEMKDAIMELAEEEGIDMVDWIRTAINERLKRVHELKKSDEMLDDEFAKKFNQMFDKKMAELGLSAGMVHGLAFAESPAAGFEKAKSYARGKY